MLECVGSLTQQWLGQRLLFCSHGNAIGLLLNAMDPDPAFGYRQWQAMTTPALYEIDLMASGVCVVALQL